MTEEIRPEGTSEAAPEVQMDVTGSGETGTAVEERTEAEVSAEKQGPEKLRQEVSIKETGPCKKHIRVVVNSDDIKSRMGDHFKKLAVDANMTGFRPGKAPRRLIEKRFFKDVSRQVKGEVLLASLEQLGEEHNIAPLSPPQIDPEKIELPKDGPLVYEFEVEVRPEFDLPEYKGLKLQRPFRNLSDDDIAEARRRVLSDHGQIVPKEGGAAEIGDLIVADVTVRYGEMEVGKIREATLRVERQLAFKDGIAPKFGDQVKGVKAGETRIVDIKLAQTAAAGMGGHLTQGTLEVKDVKTLRLPELTPEYCDANFGVRTPEMVDELIRAALERNIAHEQRRFARNQVMELFNKQANWQLPPDLLRRQARRALGRRIMEMRSDGISDAEIDKRRRVLEQDILETTAMTLKEHFFLQKIAETEKIDVSEDDLDDEVIRMANQTGESPRKVRARLEKEDMLEALMAEMIERKALDLILDSAVYEDVDVGAIPQDSGSMSTVEEQAITGLMVDPTAEAEKPNEAGDASAS